VELRPESVVELLNDRHALDVIARAVVSGERGLGEAADAIAVLDHASNRSPTRTAKPGSTSSPVRRSSP
jgi:hypothetical protein